MKEFKSFYKTVSTSEGDRCKYPTRLDSYGCGCQHDCSYCYAKSLLDFRGLWNPNEPSVASLKKIERKLEKVSPGSTLRIGGMTDCFQPIERVEGVTREVIKMLNERNIKYLIVTKSDLVVEYENILRPDLAHIQISVTSTVPVDFEKAVPPDRRIRAVLQLQDDFDTRIRLSPLLHEFIDFDHINGVGIKKAVVEFLRVNTWVKRWLNIDYSEYTLKSGGYWHLPLERKIELLDKVKIPNVVICEDVPEHYRKWNGENKCDCCN